MSGLDGCIVDIVEIILHMEDYSEEVPVPLADSMVTAKYKARQEYTLCSKVLLINAF